MAESALAAAAGKPYVLRSREPVYFSLPVPFSDTVSTYVYFAITDPPAGERPELQARAFLEASIKLPSGLPGAGTEVRVAVNATLRRVATVVNGSTSSQRVAAEVAGNVLDPVAPVAAMPFIKLTGLVFAFNASVLPLPKLHDSSVYVLGTPGTAIIEYIEADRVSGWMPPRKGRACTCACPD